MFEVEYSNQAWRFLRKTEKKLTERLLRKIESLREQPITHDTKESEATKRSYSELGLEIIEFYTKLTIKLIR